MIGEGEPPNLKIITAERKKTTILIDKAELSFVTHAIIRLTINKVSTQSIRIIFLLVK